MNNMLIHIAHNKRSTSDTQDYQTHATVESLSEVKNDLISLIAVQSFDEFMKNHTGARTQQENTQLGLSKHRRDFDIKW